MKGDKSLYYRTLYGVMPPLSVIYGNDVRVHEVVRNLIEYYFPNIRRIWDPTCGTENHQFAPYLEYRDGKWWYLGKIEYVASDISRTRWNCRDGECLVVDLLSPPYPFPDGYADIIVYDPPFLATSREDRRATDYGMERDRSPAEIKEFFKESVFKEFWRIARFGVIIKGTDFYYPVLSNNLVLFMHDILDVDMVRRYFRIVAAHIYRFFSTSIPLVRSRLGATGVKRMMKVHTYYVVLYKVPYK